MCLIKEDTKKKGYKGVKACDFDINNLIIALNVNQNDRSY